MSESKIGSIRSRMAVACGRMRKESGAVSGSSLRFWCRHRGSDMACRLEDLGWKVKEAGRNDGAMQRGVDGEGRRRDRPTNTEPRLGLIRGGMWNARVEGLKRGGR